MATTQPQPVQNALTLIITPRSPEDAIAIRQFAESVAAMDPNPVHEALTQSGIVHFARFIFFENDQLGVITTFDGSFEDYTNAFVDLLGDAFNAILAHAKDAPPLPVQEHREEFVAYAAANNLESVLPFYSAYPNLTVLDILALAEKG